MCASALPQQRIVSDHSEWARHDRAKLLISLWQRDAITDTVTDSSTLALTDSMAPIARAPRPVSVGRCCSLETRAGGVRRPILRG